MADKEKTIEMLFNDDSLSELSEDFKTKATVIFENAVATKVAEEKEALEEAYVEKLEEEVKKIEEDFEEKIDSYLTYVAEEWVKENKLAIEQGIQVEIAENFLKGMKTLFEESYVEIPENKVDIVAEMAEELEKKRTSLDEAMNMNIELQHELLEMKKMNIVKECTDGLADTQVDKVKDLVEMIEYEDDEQFSTRVKDIVENYFKKGVNEQNDENDENDDEKEKDEKEETNESMDRYIKALSESMRI